MTDHKFTDAEIVKALECCLNGNVNKSQVEVCSPCPFFHDGNCTDSLKQNALDLINRQKAQIESLNAVHADMTESLRLAAEANKDMQAEIEKLGRDRYQILPDGRLELIPRTDINAIKSEAIKDFAERLKEGHDQCDGEEDVLWLIDKIVKEMTEEKTNELSCEST